MSDGWSREDVDGRCREYGWGGSGMGWYSWDPNTEDLDPRFEGEGGTAKWEQMALFEESGT